MTTKKPDAPKKSKYARTPTFKVPPAGTVAAYPTGTPRPTKYDWGGARRLLEGNPGLWVLVFNEFSTGMYAYVRKGGPAALHGMGGEFQISLRNQTTKGKVRSGSLWMRWIPEDWTDEQQRIAEATHLANEGAL